MQRPCSHKDLSNQRTTSSGERRSEECRSGDGHLGWPPRIMKFIHLRNVFQKEVITFSRLWEEEEAHLWRSSSHLPKKIPQSMRNMKISTLEELLIHPSICIRNDAIMNEEDGEVEGSRRSLPTKKIKISIQLSSHDIILLCICLYSVDVLCMIGCLH